MPAILNLGWGLLKLAVECMVPGVGGFARVVVGDWAGGLAADTRVGRVAGAGAERAIDRFGNKVVQGWWDWLRGKPAAEQQAAFRELAALPPEQVDQIVEEILHRLQPEASPEDLASFKTYAREIPGCVGRSLVRDRSGELSLPFALELSQPEALVRLLPTDVPPYAAPCELPGTRYRLEAHVASGGFGAVYRAGHPDMQHLPLAIKFCLDRSLKRESLRQELANLERLQKAAGASWSPQIVRLYGYNLDHDTPFLVYEFVPGGNLTRYLEEYRLGPERGLAPDAALAVVRSIAQALAFAHRHGLVHRDLKPANVLCDGAGFKLADFGISGVTARQAAQVSRIGTMAASQLSAAEQASLFRGAGTPLYMDVEQRRGGPPDPRHDLYSLGVLWYQLLAGDVTKELHPGWAKELARKFGVPAEHIGLIERCVGWVEERPKDAGELLVELGQGPPPPPRAEPEKATTAPLPAVRGELLLARLRAVVEAHEAIERIRASSPAPGSPEKF